jgi:ABC-type sugar transport system substrate-binding protein
VNLLKSQHVRVKPGPRAVTTLLAVAVLAAIAGCGSSSKSGSTGTAAAAAGGGSSLAGKRVVLVTVPSSNPWAAVLNRTVTNTLGSRGAKVQVLGSLDPAGQAQLLNTAVPEHPNLIMLEALDSAAVAPAIAKAKAQGVTVLNLDGRAEPSVAGGLHQVLSNSVALGTYAAQNLVDGLRAEGRKSGNIALITGTASMLVTQDRLKGFDAVMHAYPQYKVVSVQDGNWDPVKSGQIAAQLFAKYGCSGLQGAYGMADYMAVPIVTAAKQAGCPVGVKNHGLIVTGSNCFKVGIDAIRAGTMYGTATEDPGTIARLASQYALKLLSGQAVPSTVTVHEDRVDPQTLSRFAAQCSQA